MANPLMIQNFLGDEDNVEDDEPNPESTFSDPEESPDEIRKGAKQVVESDPEQVLMASSQEVLPKTEDSQPQYPYRPPESLDKGGD